MALRGRLEEAFALHKKAEALCLELGNKDSLQRSYTNQALILKDWGRPGRDHSPKRERPWPARSHAKTRLLGQKRDGRIAFKSLTAEEVQRQQMNIIALIDTKPELPGETIGTVISTRSTIADAFTANDAF